MTQNNLGKKTVGVDNLKFLTPKKKMDLVNQVRLDGKVSLIRKVYIPKNNTEMRPLEIPTIKDRAKQCLALLVLEPG